MDWHSRISKELAGITNNDRIFEPFRNRRLVLLGGSGFLGKWILSSILEANRVHGCNVELIVLSSDVEKLRESHPDFEKDFKSIKIDFRNTNNDFELPEADFIIHAATSTNPNIHQKSESAILTVAENSTNLILKSAAKFGNQPKVLHLSSGIVYGRNTNLDSLIQETEVVSTNSIPDTYEGSKLLIESMLDRATYEGIVRASNPRLFAFAGPGLPLDKHFAIGNFMRDCLEGRKIKILGNPKTLRSYLYPTDAVTWVLKILANPTTSPINIGSDQSISLFDLANLISNKLGGVGVQIEPNSSIADSYVPSVEQASRIYALSVKVDLESAILRWRDYLRFS